MIRHKIESRVKEAADLIRSIKWEDKNFYANWLAQQYFLVRHTPRLLCAMALSTPLDNTDHFDEAIHHLKEENGHDKWLLSDIKNLGYRINDFEPLPETKALIQSQYYQIEYDDPMSLCGYSQYLEYLAVVVAKEIADRIEPTYGKKCLVFLRGHADVDVGHAEDGWKRLVDLPKAKEIKIIENLEMCSMLYLTILNKLNNLKLSKKVA